MPIAQGGGFKRRWTWISTQRQSTHSASAIVSTEKEKILSAHARDNRARTPDIALRAAWTTPHFRMDLFGVFLFGILFLNDRITHKHDTYSLTYFTRLILHWIGWNNIMPKEFWGRTQISENIFIYVGII